MNNELTTEQEIQITRDKALRNKVLSEVEEEVEKNRKSYPKDWECDYTLTLINNLRVK